MPRFFKKRRKVSFLSEHKITFVDYKDERILRRFVNERGKIVPRRVTGLTAKQQRMVTTAIKRARHMAILPYAGEAMR